MTSEAPEPASGGQIIDLVDALRASLAPKKPAKPAAEAPAPAPVLVAKERKGAKRAAAGPVAEVAEMPARARARK